VTPLGGYALTLAVKEKPDQKLLNEFFATYPQLVVDGVLGQRNSVVVRKRSDDASQSFEIWRPMLASEDEDLEPDLAALVHVPCWVFQISLDSNPPKEDWELANSLARFIATTCEGAVFYDELGKVVWPEAATKKMASPPEKGRLIDLVKLEWYVHLSQLSVDTSSPFLTSLRKLYPEAVPIRFGTVEPYQGLLRSEDEGPFDELWKKSNGSQSRDNLNFGMIHFTAKSPCFGGFISFPPRLVGVGKKPEEQFVRISLSFDRAPFSNDSDTCEKLVNLFSGLAENLRAFYGHSYVERNWTTYRRLSFTPKTDQLPGTEHYPLPMGHEWFGIPPAPTWLVWLGRPYVQLVQESLRNVEHFMSEDGILIRRGPKPMDLDQLQATTLSFPTRLLAQVVEDPWLREKAGRWSYRTKKAEVVPRLDS